MIWFIWLNSWDWILHVSNHDDLVLPRESAQGCPHYWVMAHTEILHLSEKLQNYSKQAQRGVQPKEIYPGGSETSGKWAMEIVLTPNKDSHIKGIAIH